MLTRLSITFHFLIRTFAPEDHLILTSNCAMKSPISLIVPRRSRRLQGHSVSSLFTTADNTSEPAVTRKKRKLSTSKAKQSAKKIESKVTDLGVTQDAFLPRTREESLKAKNPTLEVIGGVYCIRQYICIP